MGSLASRPTIPAVQTIYTPVYMPSTPTTTTQTPSVDPVPTPEADPDQQGSARRSASLLERNRGALSTVLTSFRGILSPSTTPQRKTLLGE